MVTGQMGDLSPTLVFLSSRKGPEGAPEEARPYELGEAQADVSSLAIAFPQSYMAWVLVG